MTKNAYLVFRTLGDQTLLGRLDGISYRMMTLDMSVEYRENLLIQ